MGSFASNASGAITLGPLGVTATGSFSTTATGAITLGTLSVAATGSFASKASGAITLGPLGVTATGSFSTTATGSYHACPVSRNSNRKLFDDRIGGRHAWAAHGFRRWYHRPVWCRRYHAGCPYSLRSRIIPGCWVRLYCSGRTGGIWRWKYRPNWRGKYHAWASDRFWSRIAYSVGISVLRASARLDTERTPRAYGHCRQLNLYDSPTSGSRPGSRTCSHLLHSGQAAGPCPDGKRRHGNCARAA